MNVFWEGWAFGLFCGVLLGIGVSIIASWIEYRRNKRDYSTERIFGGDKKE